MPKITKYVTDIEKSAEAKRKKKRDKVAKEVGNMGVLGEAKKADKKKRRGK